MNQKSPDTCIDTAVFAALKELEVIAPGILSELIALFFETTPKRLAKIKMGVATLDPEPILAATHSLRASAGNLGAKRIGTLCLEIDAAAEKRQFGQLQPLFEDLETACTNAMNELQKWE